MNPRWTWAAIAVALIAASDGRAQAPTRVGLRVQLKGTDVRSACVPAGKKVEEVEASLAVALVQRILESGFWSHFCWKIEPYQSQNPPDGSLLVTIHDLPNEKGELQAEVRIGLLNSELPPCATFRLQQGRGPKYPPPKVLEELLCERFADVCSSDKLDEFHQRFRKQVKVGKGLVRTPGGSDSLQGMVLLPWGEFGRFGEAKFKFRYAGSSAVEELVSVGKGHPMPFALPEGGPNLCCIETLHERVPQTTPAQPVDVYLEMTLQELLLKNPPVAASCEATSTGAVRISVMP